MKLTKFILLVCIFSITFSCKKNDDHKLAPNIIIILADDLAYGDLSITGNQIVETPSLEKLAKEGAFAEKFYVSPAGAPTTASLLTGRYHQKIKVLNTISGQENTALKEQNFADIFKSLGYKTGVFGKWNNGSYFTSHPLDAGFNEFVGFTSDLKKSYFNITLEKNRNLLKTEGYLPNVVTNEALKFIEKSNSEKKPFLCFIPYQAPEKSHQIPKKYFNKYKSKGLDSLNATIYGMVENIDDNVGKINKKIKDLDIEENTIIVYLSDNGPVNVRYNASLKGKMNSVDEGGVNVPFIIKYKNKINANFTIDKPLAHIDILPTLLDLAGINFKFKNKIDGKSFKKLLAGKEDETFTNRPLFEEWNGNKRLLSGDFLMINEALFNIKKDKSQERYIRRFNQQIYDSLRAKYDVWYTNLPKRVAETPIDKN